MSTSSRILGISFYNISKISFVLYLLYANIISWTVFVLPGLSTALICLSLLCMIVAENGKLVNSGHFLCYVFFVIYSLLIGLIIAYNKSTMISTVIEVSEYIIALYLIIRFSENDNSIDFVSDAFLVLGVVSSIFVVFSGAVIENRASFSEQVNVNVVGAMLSFTVGFLLYRFIRMKKTIFRSVVVIGILALLAIAILSTVSKKAILSAGALILFWFVCCYFSSFKQFQWIVRVFILGAFIFICYKAVMWYISNDASNFEYLYWRFSKTFSGESTNERKDFMKSAIQTFWNHPIFGVGLGNFKYYNSVRLVYSHCYYTEVLAGSGIVGTIAFNIPLVTSILYIFKIVFLRNGSSKHEDHHYTEDKYMVCIILVFLFSCTTQIIFHVSSLFYVMSTIVAYSVVRRNQNYVEEYE